MTPESASPAAKPSRAKKRTAPQGRTKSSGNAQPKGAASKLVVFFRHGIAEEPSEEKGDGERSLTTSGHDRTKRSAKGLAKAVGKVDALYASPHLRALQTALWVTKAYGTKVQVRTTEALLPDADPAAVCDLVRATEASVVILVGHEPNLTRTMSMLLGAGELKVNLKRAGCAAVLLDDGGRGTLEWVLAPRMLRGM